VLPTQSETITAVATGSHCRVGDDHSVHLSFEQILPGTGPAGHPEDPDFFYTAWVGGFNDSR
jgi:hypothetical protein